VVFVLERFIAGQTVQEARIKVKFKMVSVLELFTPLVQAARENSMRTRLKTVERLTCLFLMLTSVLVTLLLMPSVVAKMSVLGVKPSSGSVGTLVTITANVTTANGTYEVYFDQSLTASGTASGNNVNATFTVPETTAGNHTVSVTDVTTGDNATGTFNVTTSYSLSIPAMAKPLQEGDSVPISANITGGESGKSYAMNVTVEAPTNVSYVKMLDVVASAFGNGTTTASYPGDFSTGANTSFVGGYTIFLNATLDQKAFSVGLTNSTEYHRSQTVNVKALYEPSENVTLTIAGKNIQDSVNLTDPSGLINYNWTVPLNATIGSYAVSVVSLSGHTVKSPADVQNFTVPGFAVNVTARNLAGESVPSITLSALENGTVVNNATSDTAGLGILNLEVGNYTCEAYAQSRNVGELMISVNDTVSLDLFCNLTNLRVQVVSFVNGTELSIPDAGVYLVEYGQTFSTDLNGTAVIHSLLPNSTYDLTVTRYGTSFNVTSIPRLLVNETAVAWFNVTVSCPTLALRVVATKSGGKPFDNALVRVQELSGLPSFEEYTDANGSAVFNPPLGRYTVRVYDPSGVVLNETAVDLFQNASTSVRCDWYGLTLSVRVVDYFGQAISNVVVKLQREGEPTMSATTQADGTATFNNVVGGALEATFYLGGSTQPVMAQGLSIQNSTTVQVTIGKYLVFAGLLVETSQFATVIVVVLAVVLVLAVEVYRVRRFRAEKGEPESSDKES
jgi:hypothetical protein